ncbi:unnamed protein product [Rotaria sp. Silwood2]|nr:unnamed protein product [Rotaria sp. Silwood2]CAF4155722.1 unnamed protein product [Rotaria sp. Silwood2]
MTDEPYCTLSYYSSFNDENQYEKPNINYTTNPYSIPIVSLTTDIDSKKKRIRRSKHIPHHLRPQHIVERRERRRVQDVNQALLPFNTNNNKDQLNSTRISKVRMLRKVVAYIEALQNILNETN